MTTKEAAGKYARGYVITPDFAEMAILMPPGAEYFGITKAPVACFVEIVPRGVMPGLTKAEADVGYEPTNKLAEIAADGSMIPRPVSPGDVVKIVSQDYATTATPLGAIAVELEGSLQLPATLESWPDAAELTILTTEKLDIVDGVAFSKTIQVRGGIGPLTFEVDASYGDMALPSGLSLNTSTGAITGTPDTPGNYDFQINVSDSHATPLTAEQVYTGTVLEAAPVITPDASIVQAVLGEVYAGDTIVCAGGEPVVVLSIKDGGRGGGDGGLPSGMTFTDQTDGTADIAGTPTEHGSFPFSVDAVDSEDRTDNEDFTLVVLPLDISTTSLPNGTENAAYSEVVTVLGGADANGAPGGTVSIVLAGDLPGGLSFLDNGDGTATISGTVDDATAGAWPLTFTATDEEGNVDVQNITLTIIAD